MTVGQIVSTEKSCAKCREVKPLDQFSRRKDGRDGRHAACKACINAARRAYVAANREKVAELRRAIYQANREVIARRTRSYREANPHMTWEYNYRRRAIEYGHLPIVQEFTRDDLIAAYGDACAHCGGDWSELDHFPVAVSRGGPHTLENVRPSCAPCNRQAWQQQGTTTDQPVNVQRTSSGRLRPVCEVCGRRGAPQPDSGGRVGLFDLARGWSCAPYPVDFQHRDGSTGSRYVCPTCDRAQQ